MTALQIDTGVNGAKRQSWRQANPRDVLFRLIKDNPEMDEGQLQVELWAIVQKDQSQLHTIFEYWFANNYRSLRHPPEVHGGRKVQRKTVEIGIRSQLEHHIADQVEQKIQLILLDMLLPSGKQLRASTREELVECGGWMGRVAERLHPNQTIEQAGISEEDLRELYTA